MESCTELHDTQGQIEETYTEIYTHGPQSRGAAGSVILALWGKLVTRRRESTGGRAGTVILALRQYPQGGAHRHSPRKRKSIKRSPLSSQSCKSTPLPSFQRRREYPHPCNTAMSHRHPFVNELFPNYADYHYFTRIYESSFS